MSLGLLLLYLALAGPERFKKWDVGAGESGR
jgi:hypothetical protein